MFCFVTMPPLQRLDLFIFIFHIIISCWENPHVIKQPYERFSITVGIDVLGDILGLPDRHKSEKLPRLFTKYAIRFME